MPFLLYLLLSFVSGTCPSDARIYPIMLGKTGNTFLGIDWLVLSDESGNPEFIMTGQQNEDKETKSSQAHYLIRMDYEGRVLWFKEYLLGKTYRGGKNYWP